MDVEQDRPELIRYRLRWPLRLTRAGMVAERITRAFWPVWTLAFLFIAAVALGFQDWAPLELFWLTCIALPVALVWALWRGARAFRWPTLAEVETRLDASMPGRPIAGLTDQQAVGAGDAASEAVWRAHRTRLMKRAAAARAPQPDLRLASRDPFAVRYVAATFLILALVFGSLWRLADIGRAPVVAGAAPAAVAATWEGWAEPPAYTGKPQLYLTKLPAGPLDLPKGTKIILRLYGAPDVVDLRQTLTLEPLADAPPAGGPRAFEFIAERSGQLELTGEGGRIWEVRILPDAPPSLSLTGQMDRKADGTMQQAFAATDDFGIVSGEVRFELDLGAVDRRHGLAADPEAQAPLIFDLPRPGRASRTDMKAVLAEDASEHPWANLPVVMVMSVTDGLGQTTSTPPEHLLLPGRRFFDPLAGAVAEMRRDLLWSRVNAKRSAQILRAVSHRPEGFVRNQKAYLLLRVAIRRLEAGQAQGPLSVAVRDEVAGALWQVAVLLEDGGLSDALERMRQAEERLSQAIRNGASKDEIQKLMDELRDATDNYLNMLAEKGEQTDPADKFARNKPETRNITGDQIQQMMDEIQKLMEEGRMAEAQQLLDQLSQMMENLKVTQEPGGEGQEGPGGKAMKDLRQTLRDQQRLSDDAFRKQQEGGSGQQGQPEGGTTDAPGEGAAGEGAAPEDGQSLADRQEALREGLGRQRGQLPDAQGQDADRARKSLDDAARAMDEAEQALRDGELPKAIDRQAEAIGKLRDGMRSLSEALAEDANRLPGADGQAGADPSGREVPRDPLGRTEGVEGQVGSGENLLQGEDVYRHARDLLDEIRRRSADQARPDQERDYLRRLLDRY